MAPGAGTTLGRAGLRIESAGAGFVAQVVFPHLDRITQAGDRAGVVDGLPAIIEQLDKLRPGLRIFLVQPDFVAVRAAPESKINS